MVKALCKGTCKDYSPTWDVGFCKTYGRDTGVVRCRTCYEFLKWEGLWCPCCGCRVSRRPKNPAIKIEYARM